MSSLQRHRQLSERAHECISKALDGETNSSLSIQTTLALYEQGHAALKEALGLPMTLSERRSVETENSKMLRNFLRTEERMEELKSKLPVTARPGSGGAFHLALRFKSCPHSNWLVKPHEGQHSPVVTIRSVAGVKRQGSSSSLPPERVSSVLALHILITFYTNDIRQSIRL